MAELNKLEIAMLEAIAAQHSEQRAGLVAQFRAATCVSRRNTGAGFFTNLAVDHRKVSPVVLRSPVGDVWADIEGFQDPMNFLVFMGGGYALQLEGCTIRDDTTGTEFDKVGFALRPGSPEKVPESH